MVLMNIICISILFVIFVLMLNGYFKNAFFSVSVLYKFSLFLAPVLLFLVNFIYLAIKGSSYLFLSFIPLLIPVLHSIKNKYQDSSGHNSYKIFQQFSEEFILLANKNGVSLTSDDIRIRIKKRNEISIIFNVYSTKDEKKIKDIKGDFLKFINVNTQKYKVEILIDKKKAEYKAVPIIQ